ncbi:MAG: InlB B-repeat-containing protein [Firmicutes bacterium]|nr:InlB B-repeat-containing protein [Bacillota bacterium]
MKKKIRFSVSVLLVSILTALCIVGFAGCDPSWWAEFETNGGTDIVLSADDALVVDKRGPNTIGFWLGGTIQESPTTTKEGFVFDGWYEKSDFSGEPVIFPYNVPGGNRDGGTYTTKLYAKWFEA